MRLALGGFLLLAVAAVSLSPVLVVIAGSFEDSGAWRSLLFESGQARSALGYSVLFAARAPFAALIGFLLAWLLIRVRIPGREFIEFMLWIAFFLPLIPVTLGWMLLLDSPTGLLNKWLAALPFVDGPVFDVSSLAGILWVHMTASSVPVMVILLGPAIRQMDASFEEAGRVCGSGPFEVFRRITLPLLLPAIVTGAILGFIRGLEAFEVEQLLGVKEKIYVYSTHVYALINWEPPRFSEAMAMSTLVLGGLLVIALFYQRYTSERGHATVTGSGMSIREIPLGRGRWILAALFFALVFVTVVVPIAFLLLGTSMTLFGFFHIPGPFTTEHWLTVLDDPAFVPSIVNTLILGLGAAALGVFSYAVIAYAIVRTRIGFRPLTNFLAWLPWCIPGILLGVGMLTLVLFTPFLYAALWLDLRACDRHRGGAAAARREHDEDLRGADRAGAGARISGMRRRLVADLSADRHSADEADAYQHLRAGRHCRHTRREHGAAARPALFPAALGADARIRQQRRCRAGGGGRRVHVDPGDCGRDRGAPLRPPDRQPKIERRCRYRPDSCPAAGAVIR